MEDQQKDVFLYGDGTLMQLRDEQEFGTCVVSVAAEPMPIAAAPASLEQKVDALIVAVASLQRRLDSIDATLARAISR